MIVDLWRGNERYCKVDMPADHWQWNIRHSRRFSVGLQETLDPREMTDAVEHFEFNPLTYRYESQNFRSLPSWVIQQELEEQEEADRRARLDRISRMFAGSPA